MSVAMCTPSPGAAARTSSSSARSSPPMRSWTRSLTTAFWVPFAMTMMLGTESPHRRSEETNVATS